MQIYMLKEMKNNKILYIGKDSLGYNRINNHEYTAETNPGKSLLYKYLSSHKQNEDYIWIYWFGNHLIDSKKQLSEIEKGLIKEMQPKFNIRHKGGK